jgi:hypothetical protein
VSVAAAAAQLVDALEAAGLRVAVRDGDITPPCVYIQIGTTSDANGPFAGATGAVFYVYYIPIRGIDNLTGDAEAIDAIYAALGPITWAELTGTRTSVTVANTSWPAYRFDASIIALTVPTVAPGPIIDTGGDAAAWTTTGPGFSSDPAEGNPAPSYAVPDSVSAGGGIAYIQTGILADYAADIWIPAFTGNGVVADFYFGCDVAGVGYNARLDNRPGGVAGIAGSGGWGTPGAPDSGGVLTTGGWHHLEVVADPTVLTMILDGTTVYTGDAAGYYPDARPLGPYIGLASALAVTHYDNIIIGATTRERPAHAHRG